jgi:hypothetical protein
MLAVALPTATADRDRRRERRQPAWQQANEHSPSFQRWNSTPLQYPSASGLALFRLGATAWASLAICQRLTSAQRSLHLQMPRIVARRRGSRLQEVQSSRNFGNGWLGPFPRTAAVDVRSSLRRMKVGCRLEQHDACIPALPPAACRCGGGRAHGYRPRRP